MGNRLSVVRPRPPAILAWTAHGKGADRKAGDGIWSARVRMPAGLEPELAASYMVKVTSRLLDGDLRESVGGFLYSNPGAHLTGRYRDEVRDGNLGDLRLPCVLQEGVAEPGERDQEEQRQDA